MNDDPEFLSKSNAVRQAIARTETPLALGWDVLRKARRDSGAHLTDKELFFAGAGYLFDAIAHSLTSGDEPTEEDIQLLAKIHKELFEFHVHFNTKLEEK